ncbi:MAG: nucleotidyltransferase family protein [Anaerolineae bacterium]|nr:nucleotidyltransferase family protein [Anaerolineae bacterium]MEB2287231.1 nucleotidyltransferase family protein [Anaerolineae bacterium]
MTTLEELRAKREEILRLAARHGASNVRVFGSVLRGEAGPDSDIDLLVEGLEHAAWGGGALLMELQELLEQRVDLVTPGDLHPLIRDEILKEAEPL